MYAVKTTASRETIKYLKNYFNDYSRPRVLITDRGTSFTSGEFEEFMKGNNIEHIRIATASPQANGQVERYNRMLAPMLGKLYEGKDWHKSLDEIEFAINNTVNRATGETPSRLLFGVEQRGKIVDAVREYVLESEECKVDTWERRLKAAQKMEETREYNDQYRNRKRKAAHEYEEGDLVVVRNFESVGGKLVPHYRGPYRVARKLRRDRYVVEDVEGCQISQRPYTGTWEAAKMKPWRLTNVKGRDGEESESESDNDDDQGEQRRKT